MPESKRQTPDVDPIAGRLLEIVRELSGELRPDARGLSVALDTSLDRELGFDSLSRVELLLRIEREFGAHLPERTFSLAETPADLLKAVRAAANVPTARAAPVAAPLTLDETGDVPHTARTLQEVLEFHVQRHPERTHVRLYETDATIPQDISYGALANGAERVAAGLLERGIGPGQSVAIMLPTSRDYLECFFAVLLAGAVPVPIYPPARPSQLEDHLRRHARILANADARLLITVAEGKRAGRLLKRHVERLGSVVTPEDLSSAHGHYVPRFASPDDLALLQYTSGSTGQPKGVTLTHAQLLSNIRIMGNWVRADSRDVFVSWLPMYHDMGLIGAWLGSLYFAMLSVLMPPTAFLLRPWRWMRAVHEHRGTITAAPNFAYELCLSKVPDSTLEGLDLASLRLAVNGAEPVSPRTLRRFGERYASFGFDFAAMTPVYGLAECAVGLAFPPLGRGPLIDRVDQSTFERTGRAEPARESTSRVLELVACGQPLPGYEIRIVDPSGHELGEREEGRLEFRGPSTTAGYINNPEATRRLFDGDWLDSGDLAYISGGDVYLTSRTKDLIIRAGRNIYPYDLEEAVGDLTTVRKGCVAVFGATDPASHAERLVVLAETRLTDPAALQKTRAEIESIANRIVGAAPDDVVLVAPRTVLKTSSGKIRRAACRELYERGAVRRGPRSPAWQIARVWIGGITPSWRRARRSASALAFAMRAYLTFGLILPAALAGVFVLPSVASRWALLGTCARTLLRLTGTPMVVKGREHLGSTKGCVFVSNHASYLDGLVLFAALPHPVAFVAKGELRERALPRWFLNRIGAHFVERFDVEAGTADARRLAKEAGSGRPLLFFPEGTFTRYPGLHQFHLGAFAAAVDNGVPVIPISIRGTRSMLRGNDAYPRRGAVTVVISQPLLPAGEGWQAAMALRNQAREQILGFCGEPDLGHTLARPPER